MAKKLRAMTIKERCGKEYRKKHPCKSCEYKNGITTCDISYEDRYSNKPYHTKKGKYIMKVVGDE